MYTHTLFQLRKKINTSLNWSIGSRANASQILKVDVAPSTGTGVNQFDSCTSSNKSSDIPGLTRHRLSEFTSVFVGNLKEADDLIHFII